MQFFDPLAILAGFDISSQFNWIVQDREWIAPNLQSNHNPQDCKILCRNCQDFGNLFATQFDRPDCDHNRWHLVAIRVNCARIAPNFQSRCNRQICEEVVLIVGGLRWTAAALVGDLLSRLQSVDGRNSVPSGTIKAQSVIIVIGLHEI